MGPDDLSVALNELGWCMLEMDRPREAMALFNRELDIRTKIEPDDLPTLPARCTGWVGALDRCQVGQPGGRCFSDKS